LILKVLGTRYLIEAPLLLVMRTIVLMFVPSKSNWTDEFHGFQYHPWGVVLALAAAASRAFANVHDGLQSGQATQDP
jgi:hypothetical protein